MSPKSDPMMISAIHDQRLAKPGHQAAALRDHPGVDQVSHFGHMLRVELQQGADADQVTRLIEAAGVTVQGVRSGHVSVEDAFIAMVNAELRERAAAAERA